MDLENNKLTVEWVAIDRLYGSPSNPRRNDEAVPHVLASIKRFGWQQPIVARPTGEVIAGNTRLKAAQQMGLADVPVAWFSGSDTDAAAFGIADNRTHEFAAWDDSALATILQHLRTEDALEGIGFDDSAIDQLLAEMEASTKEVKDPGPGAPPNEPVSRTGDLWILGDHRLLCGDSTSAADMKRLMGDSKATLLATDPPYLVDYRGAPESSDRADAKDEHWDDYEGDESGLAFFTAFLRIALAHCVERAPVYHWHAHRRQSLVEAAWKDVGLLVHQQIIWQKPRGTLGRSHFMWAHEPCFYGWRQGSMPEKDRRPPLNALTIWELDQLGEGEESVDHPTQKPLEVFTRPMEYHTKAGEVVLEPFSGSGSQIISAESIGRRCFAMEMSTAFVDVAVIRWEKATGKCAVLDEGGKGRTFNEAKQEREASIDE